MGALLFFVLSLLRIPRRPKLILIVSVLWLYSFMTGSNAPILRATMMFTFFALGYIINRQPQTLNSFSLAALAILLWNPSQLFDAGFQLSFASVLSIIIVSPKLEEVLRVRDIERDTLPGKILFFISKSLTVSTAAWFGVLPLVSLYFNILSPIAIIANIVVIPLLFVLMGSSILFVSLALISGVLGDLSCVPVRILGDLLFSINGLFLKVPFSHLRVARPSIFEIAFWYIILMLLISPTVIRLGKIKIFKKQLLFLSLFIFNIFVWKEALTREGEGLLKITFLDVGDGDSAVIQPPGSGTILIDGGKGAQGEGFDTGKSIIAPFLWNKGIFKIDAVMLSHPDEDHLGGLIYILKNFKVGCVIDNGYEKNSRTYELYIDIIKEKNLKHYIIGDGDLITGFDKLDLFILNPPKGAGNLDPNNSSVVMKLNYGNFSTLFCGDIMSKAISGLLHYDKFLESDVLKMPHHGRGLGDINVAKIFFRKASPEVSVISVGDFGIRKSVLGNNKKILTSLNIKSYETNYFGAMDVISNGATFELQPFIDRNNN